MHEFLNVAKSVDYKFNFTSNLLSSLNDRDNDNTSSQNSDSSQNAISYYGWKRFKNGKGVTNPS